MSENNEDIGEQIIDGKIRSEQDLIDLDQLQETQSDRPDHKMRFLTGHWKKFVTLVAVISTTFHLYTAGISELELLKQRSYHMAFILFMCFLVYPSFPTDARKNRNPTVFDVIFAVAGAVSAGWIGFNYTEIAMRGGFMTDIDYIMGLIFMIVLAEAARRIIGKFMLVLAGFFIAYLFLGPYAPGMFEHPGFPLRRVVHHFYMTTEGLFGIATGVSATYVYLFVTFGAFLNKSGLTELFANLALALAGHSPGGPAKVAIITSGFMGMIQGSSAANVASTGMFTIPLMKSLGFKGYFAAAVEAVASCGGQFLPPVMGASAFIMAQFLGMPYRYIAAGAAVPAALYYGAVFLQVHFRAKKLGMEGVDRSRLPALKTVLYQQGHLALPVIILVGMLAFQFTALFSAFVSIIATIFVSSLRKYTRMSVGDIIDAMVLGGKNTILTAVACASVGWVVGTMNLAGTGLLVTHYVVRLAGGTLLYTLLLTAAASMIMSKGLPTTSVYIINATLVAPALVELGVQPLVAHLYTYYWGGVSAVTPPVALAVYVGSGIAGSDIMKSGFTAMKLAIAGYLVPLYYVYWPEIVMRGEGLTVSLVFAIIGGVAAVFCMGVSAEQYFMGKVPWYKAGLLAGSIPLLIYPSILTSLLAIVLTLFVGISEYVNGREEASEVTVSG